MSIKNLFNSKGAPKIQKSVTSDELVAQVESEDFIEAKREQFNKVIPHINFATASNFAKFGSAELYYEKAFERIHNYYPYDGTLHEKIQFENSSSFLDRHIFDNIYPRTNGYVNFSGSMYITAFGGPHTASGGMIGKKFADTFDKSSIYDAVKKRTSAFEFRGEDGVTIEFWLKMNAAVSKTIMHVSSSAKAGDIKIRLTSTDRLQIVMNSGSLSTVTEDLITSATAGNQWNHFAFTIKTTGSGLVFKSFKNGELAGQKVGTSAAYNISQILPTEKGINLTLGANADGTDKLTGASIDEFRYWKKARTPEDIYNTWFIPVGGGTNKHDSNIDLGCYFKFNEGITGNSALDDTVLDYSGRFNNGKMIGTTTGARSTSSAITEKLGLTEFKDPIIYSTHPAVVAKKAEYKTSGSIADLENSSMFYSYFPAWMQEEDEQNGKQLKFLSQVIGSYFDTLWHQINFVDKIHDKHYISGSNKALPFAKELLYNQGFVMPDMFVDANILETFRQKDSNEIYEKEINEVKNTIYHNLYNNLQCIYKSKGTEKSFRNFFRSLGIGQDLVKLKMYADDSTFVLRNNYEFKSYERKFVDFNVNGHFSASIYQLRPPNGPNVNLVGDSNYLGSFSLQSEIILPRKQRVNEVNYNPFPYLSSSIMGYKHGTAYNAVSGGLQVYVVKDRLESSLDPSDSQRIKFVLSGSKASNINIHTDWYTGQYENNKWSLAVRLKHMSYPNPFIDGIGDNNYLVEFYGVEADGNTKRNYFDLSSASFGRSYYSSDKIFYAGANRTKFTGSTEKYSDIKLGYVRYWHSYLSNDAIDQHAFDSETFGTNEPFEQDLVNTYPVEIPREKTLAFHWAFNNLTGSDSLGLLNISDLSSGSLRNDYGPLSDTIQRYIPARGIGFNASSTKALDKNFLYSARKRLPDDLMSSDLTTIKTDETEQFFVDEDVSDNFYSFEKSMWGTISDEMMSMFSTALDLNNLIGQPNQKYHHRYAMADFLRDRFFDDVENDPDIEKFTSFYKWIDDSISIALQQLVPASARFSEKINNVIESHVLERNKYVHQIPILSNFESTEGSIKGIAEMKYNWRLGHAPTLPKATASVSLNAIAIGNFYDTVIRITDYNNVTKRYVLQNTATSNTGTTVSLNPGSGAVDHVVVGIQGLNSTTVTAQLVTAISSANGHAGSIIATVDSSDSKILRLTQSVSGPSGNTQLIAQETHVDGSATWAAHGIGTTSGFTGGSDNEQQNTLWHRERKAKTGLRETLRNSRNNHSLQSSGLVRREIDGTSRISDTYAVRRFAKTQDVSIAVQHTLHGGTNFGRKKNLHLFHESIAPAGALGTTSNVPQNVITVGVGTGQGIISGSLGEYNIDDPPRKRKVNFSALIGNKEGNEYAYEILGNTVVPMNVMSGTVTTGFNKKVHDQYKNGVYFTNLHNDVVGNYNETSIQGPFTEQHVGGLQYRHIDLNQYDPITGRIQTDVDRPEGWALLVREHPVSPGSDDGAFGFVGADYVSPYPSTASLKATRYRDEHAKRPINVRNIKTISGSWKVGNYKNELEIFQVSPTFQKPWAVEAYDDANTDILPQYISSRLPDTTHYQSLSAIQSYVSGNVFGKANNNRQFDGAAIVPEIPGTVAKGKFSVTGSPIQPIAANGSFEIVGTEVEGTFSKGSFEVTSSNVNSAFASGSFEITGANIQGTRGVGTFSMLEKSFPAITASYQFSVEGRSILGVKSTARFNVSGTTFAILPATASFTLGPNPLGGSRAYAIFEAGYENAVDGQTFALGRGGDTTKIEVDFDNSVTAGNTSVSPINILKGRGVLGDTQYFKGPFTISGSQQLCISMDVKITNASLGDNSSKAKYLYRSYNASGNPNIEIFFQSGSIHDNLVARHYVTTNGSLNDAYRQFCVPSLGGDEDIRNFFFFFNNGDFKFYENGVNKAIEIEDGRLGGANQEYDGVIPVSQSVFGHTANHQWYAQAEISDLVIWNSGFTIDPNTTPDFVEPAFNGGNSSVIAISGAAVEARYSFGDHPSDGIIENSYIFETTTSGSDLQIVDTARSNLAITNSDYAKKRSATDYFNTLKSAIETHNSDGNFYDVDYVQFTHQNEHATSASFSLDFNTDDTFKYGDLSPSHLSTLTLRPTSDINFARFYVVQKAESASNSINPSISVGGLTGSVINGASFRNLTSSAAGSAQVGYDLTIDRKTLTVDGKEFMFDDHGQAPKINQIQTFTTLGKCISGSSTNQVCNFNNSSYPARSTLNGGSDFSISFWHSRLGADTTTNSILQLEATSANLQEGAVWVHSNQTYLYLKIYQNATTFKTFYKTWASMDLDVRDLNHFVWVFDASAITAQLWVNGRLQDAVSTDGTATSFSHTYSSIYVAGRESSTTNELRGRLTQLSIWDTKLFATPIREIYNNARKKDLYSVSGAVKNLTHWYKLSEDDITIDYDGNLGSYVFEDFAPRFHLNRANLTAQNGNHFGVAAGLPSDTISTADFRNNLSSSLKQVLSTGSLGFDVTQTNGAFTLTTLTSGASQNGKPLSSNTTGSNNDSTQLISFLMSETAGARDHSGAVVGDKITIDSKNFIVDTDGTNSDTSTNIFTQFTGSNADIWNYLSQSIKDNSVFGTISVTDNGNNTATFHLTSSLTGSDKNVSMTETGVSFEVVTAPAGGVTHRGPFDGDYIQLRPTTNAADDRYFVADTNADGVNNTPAGYRYVNSLQGSNAAWWNALSSSIRAEGFQVSYVADSPSAGTASFTVLSNVHGAAGNNGQNTQFNGTVEGGSFFNIGGAKFFGGSDAGGALEGDTLVVGGTTFTIIHSGTPSATQILASGSTLTNDTMWNSVIDKIEAGGIFTVATSSVSESCTFTVTAIETGSISPSISETGATFTVTNAGTSGSLEKGAEAGDTITIDSQTFTIVSGAPGAAKQVSHTGSTTNFHNSLKQSIIENTAFDTITISDLGNGYHKFSLTSSVDGVAKNVAFAKNSIGARNTFQNLLGASGGQNGAGAEVGDSITIGGVEFAIVAGSPTGNQVSATGSTTQFHNSLTESIKSATVFDTISVSNLGNGYHKISLTASVTGSSHNTTITQNSNGSRATFQNLAGTSGVTDETGAEAGDTITLGSTTFTIVDGAPANSLQISTTGSTTLFHNRLTSSIKENTNFDTVTVTSVGGNFFKFQLTSSAVGAVGNASFSQNSNGSRTTFRNLVSATNGKNHRGIVDGHQLVIGSLRFTMTGSATADSSPNFYVTTTGSSAAIWSTLESKMEENGYVVTVAATGAKTAVFHVTSSATGSSQNTAMSGTSPTFTAFSGLSGGTNIVPAVLSPIDNVIQIPNKTSAISERNIVTRFSAPGGVEIQTLSYLDAYTQTYSVHNALPFRNLPVLLDSGESGTIRVEDHLGHRRGLNTLRALHMGKFGTDATYGAVSVESYPTNGSFNKQHRNTSKRMEYSGSSIITGSNHDNAFITTTMPRSELQYSWINNATSGSDGPVQRILGYAPRNGFVSSSDGYHEAIVFPSASTIYGSP